MIQASSPAKLQRGGHTYVIPSSHAAAGQPFSIQLGKRGKIEVTYESRTAKPVISVSHVSGHSSSHEDSSRRAYDSRSHPSPRAPRSDVATIGSTTYMHSNPSSVQGGHSYHREHKSSTPRHTDHSLPSVSKSPYVASNGLLAVPAQGATYERQRRHSSTQESRPVAIPRAGETRSPEKHAHFSLPHSAPSNYALAERVPASPRQPSRHHHSHSQDSYFREAPRGWYNRRGDQFIQRGQVRRQPPHLEWHRVFAGYPEPGKGWMNEERQFMPYHGGILLNHA